MSTKNFSHISADGGIAMVDVGPKDVTERVAIAGAVVELNARTMQLLQEAALPKGDALTTAKIAGIMAAKRTAELVPLCHPLALTLVDVRFAIVGNTVRLEAETRTRGRTGVEMEALVAVQIAAATIYDMCKAVQKDILIRDVRLLYKSGGKSGVFRAGAPNPGDAS